jgi:uncharacterized protein YpmS
MSRKFLILVAILAVATATLACNLGRRAAETPAPLIPVSTEAVQSLEETAVNSYNELQQTGEVNLTVTEEQLTSMVALELEQQGADGISNPQVFLRDGQIQLTGDVQTQGISATARMAMEVDIDGNGRPSLQIVSANIGPFPVPDSLIENVETRLNQAFLNELDERAPNLVVESVVIADGSMTITGHTR